MGPVQAAAPTLSRADHGWNVVDQPEHLFRQLVLKARHNKLLNARRHSVVARSGREPRNY